jgi:hypothetical protein
MRRLHCVPCASDDGLEIVRGAGFCLLFRLHTPLFRLDTAFALDRRRLGDLRERSDGTRDAERARTMKKLGWILVSACSITLGCSAPTEDVPARQEALENVVLDDDERNFALPLSDVRARTHVELRDVCGAIADADEPVAYETVAGPLPAAAGGTLVDGTYTLVAITAASRDTVSARVLRAATTVRYDQGHYEIVSGIKAERHAGTYDVDVMQRTIFRAVACPGERVELGKYTTDGQTLTLFSPDHSVSYTYARR